MSPPSFSFWERRLVPSTGACETASREGNSDGRARFVVDETHLGFSLDMSLANDQIPGGRLDGCQLAD